VVTEAPANSGSQYFNYRERFPILLLALSDVHYKFTAVDVGSYEEKSCGGIFSNSKMGKADERKEVNVPEDKPLAGITENFPHVTVGDEAFPLKRHLLRPHPRLQTQENQENQIFKPLKPRHENMIFKNSVRTAKKTQLFTITKINWLTLFKKIIAVYIENHTNP
jgi:hypothetical protein